MRARFWFAFSVLVIGLAGCQLVESILLPDNPTPVSRPSPETPAPPMGSEFHVLRDGFSFQNYTGSSPSYNLSPANLERLCGRQACARGSGSSCVPAASFRSFWKYANESSQGGRCEGMSVTSRAVYDGYLKVQQLDPSARSTYQVQFGPRVQSEVAYWQASQLTSPSKYHQPLSPSQIVWELQNSKKTYSLGFCKSDLSWCHAVNPIKIVRDSKNPQYAWIHVYDSNYPGDFRKYVGVNTASGRWKYDDIEGDSNTNTLFIRPFTNRIARATCPTDGNQDTDVEDEDQDNWGWEFWLNGDGTLLVPKDTSWIPRTTDSLEDGQLPIFVFRPGKEIKLKIVGNNLKGRTTNLAFYKRGQSLSIEGIKLDTKETDKVSISEDGNSMLYSTTDKENITFALGSTYKGADYEIKIVPESKSGGFDTRLTNHVNLKNGEHELSFEMKSQNGRLSTFAIEMTRIDDNADQKFTHQKEVLSIGGNETVVLKYGKWVKDRLPLEITRDINSDGKIDRLQSVSDDD